MVNGGVSGLGREGEREGKRVKFVQERRGRDRDWILGKTRVVLVCALDGREAALHIV
jgi:hypothetical protein